MKKAVSRYLFSQKTQKQPFADVLQKKCSYRFRNIHRKTPVLPCGICKIFKNTFFYKTPPVAASENTITDV